MPQGTSVDRVYQALLRQGKDEGTAARIAQAQTGLSLQTGKKPKTHGKQQMSKNLFDITSKQFIKMLKAGNFDESKHQRDQRGRFTSGGGVAAGVAGAVGLGLAGAAAGVPGLRSLAPGIRRAVLASRTRAARGAAMNVRNATTERGDAARAAYGAVSARGKERAHTNALRHIRDQFSPAARRRHRRGKYT